MDANFWYIIGGCTALVGLLLFLLAWSWYRGDDSDELPLEEIEQIAQRVRKAYSPWSDPEGYGPPPRVTPVPVGDDTRNLKFPGRIYDGRQQT